MKFPIKKNSALIPFLASILFDTFNTHFIFFPNSVKDTYHDLWGKKYFSKEGKIYFQESIYNPAFLIPVEPDTKFQVQEMELVW